MFATLPPLLDRQRTWEAVTVTAAATGSATVSGAEGWVSVTQAARRCRVSARTVHRWVSTGEVESRLTEEGYRRIKSATLPAPESVSDPFSDHVSDSSAASADAVSEPVSDAFSVDPGQNGALVAALMADVAFLRAQLESRGQAEAELRRLLLHSQQTAQMLADQLQQRALPPHVEPVRRKWWWGFRR